MLYRIVLLLFILAPLTASSQTFTRTFGTSTAYDDAGCVSKYGDDVLVGGSKNDSGFVMRLYPNGALKWIRTFKFSATAPRTFVNAVRETTDGYIIGVGFSASTGGGAQQSYYFKLDGNGNFMFLKAANQNYYYQDIIEWGFEKYAVMGAKFEQPSSGSWNDLKFLFVDRFTGNILTQSPRINLTPSPGFTYIDDLIGSCSIDSSYIYTTGRFYYSAPSNPKMRPHLAKFNKSGTLKWSKYLHKAGSGTSRTYSQAMLYLAPYLYIAYGSDEVCSGGCSNYKMGMIKTDTTGTVIWDYIYDVTGSNGEFARGLVTDGTDLYMLGGTNLNAGQKDIAVLKIGQNGTCKKASAFGLTTTDESFLANYSHPLYCDSSFLYMGVGRRNSATTSDVLLIKADTALVTDCNYTPVAITRTTVTPFSANLPYQSFPDVTTVNNHPHNSPIFFAEPSPCGVPTTLTDTLSGDSVLLDASYPGATAYEWNSGQTSDTITAYSGGTYSCTVTVGCCSFIHQFVIVTCSASPFSITHDSLLCPGDTLHIGYSGTSIFNTSWEGEVYAGNTIEIIPLAGTNLFNIHASDSMGCTRDTSFTYVLELPDPISFIDPPAFCAGDSVTIQVTGDYEFTWSEGTSTYTGSFITVLADTSHTYTLAGINPTGCTVDTSYSIAVPVCNLSDEYDSLFLSTPSVLLDAFYPGATAYDWSTGDAGPTLSVSMPGIYTCTVTIGCCSYNTVFTVEACTISPIGITQTTAHCFGDVQTIALSGPYSNFTWNDGSSTFTGSTHTLTSPGTYTYTIVGTDSNGCMTDTLISSTVELQDSTEVSGPAAYCAGDTLVVSATGSYTFSWTNGSVTYAGASIMIIANGDETWTLWGTDANGCTTTASYMVDVPAPVPVTVTYLPNNFPCEGDVVVAQLSGAYTYLWSDGVSTYTGSSHTWTASNPVSYHITGTDANGCIMADTVIEINPIPYPSAAFVSDMVMDECRHKTWHFFATGDPGTYTWNINNVAAGTNNHFYTSLPHGSSTILLVADSMGCTDSNSVVIFNDTTTVITQSVSIPNIFTPNGDGVNDYFKISAAVPVSDFSIAVFDRWGILVYESNDHDFKWSGQFKNDGMADGMYLYLIRYTDPCSTEGPQQVNGWVNVSR